MKVITLVPYTKKPNVSELTRELVGWLSSRGLEVRMPEAEAEELGLGKHGRPVDALFSGCHLVIPIGGDGTALRAVGLMGSRQLPVLGVNLGEKGFLMRITPAEEYQALERVLAGDYSIESRTMLQIDITWPDGTRESRLALNEISIGREEFGRLIKLECYINDQFFNRYEVDSLILSSPTGSTAYSFSAGGPVVSPLAELVVVTPVCPHSLFNCSLVLSADDTVMVKPTDIESQMVRASIDGGELAPGISAAHVRVAEEKFKFVVTEPYSFYGSLRHIMSRWTQSNGKG